MLHLPGRGDEGAAGPGAAAGRERGPGASVPADCAAFPCFGKSDFTVVWHRGCSNLKHHRWRLWFVILACKSLIKVEMLHLTKWKIQNFFCFALAHFDLIFLNC